MDLDAQFQAMLPKYRGAIASIESAGSGGHAAVGPTHERLGRALGKYQIMEANIGPWSREILGREITADEFMANPALQDAIFDGKFGQYVQQYGPEGAAQAWFGGPGGVGKLDRKDSLGTSIGGYTEKFRNALGVPSVDRQNDLPATQGQPMNALTQLEMLQSMRPQMQDTRQDPRAFQNALAAPMQTLSLDQFRV